MRIAILYTGELRTIDQTLPFFKQNILDNEMDTTDIFAVLQTNNAENEMSYTEKLERELSIHLKTLHWFTREKYNYNTLQNILLENMNIPPEWKNYLRNSGSMVEYYQLFLAYQQMVHMEHLRNYTYDYVIRLRTDVIITKPIGSICFYPSVREIKNKFEQITKITGITHENAKENIELFMNSILYPGRIYSTTFSANYSKINNTDFLNLTNTDILNKDSEDHNINRKTFFNNLQDYLHEGKFLLTFRKNVFYMGNRKSFDKLPFLGIEYGINNSMIHTHWFDAESQLESYCKEHNVSLFNSNLLIEEDSLYKYQNKNYFNDSGELLNNDTFFFICRKGET